MLYCHIIGFRVKKKTTYEQHWIKTLTLKIRKLCVFQYYIFWRYYLTVFTLNPIFFQTIEELFFDTSNIFPYSSSCIKISLTSYNNRTKLTNKFILFNLFIERPKVHFSRRWSEHASLCSRILQQIQNISTFSVTYRCSALQCFWQFYFFTISVNYVIFVRHRRFSLRKLQNFISRDLYLDIPKQVLINMN